MKWRLILNFIFDLWNLFITIVSLGLTSSEKYDFGFTNTKKKTFQKIFNLKELGSKFDLDVKKVKPGSSMNKLGRPHFPSATYQVPRKWAFQFLRRF